jgi:cytochrome P450
MPKSRTLAPPHGPPPLSPPPKPDNPSTPGPDERFDVTVNQATFERLGLWQQQHGNLFRVRAASRAADAWIVNDPGDVKRVLISNHRNYSKGIGFERVALMLGKGIIVSDGDRWKSQRRMIQPAFHRQVIEKLSDIMTLCNEAMLARWCKAADEGATVDITTDTSELALEVILRSLFSEDFDRLIEKEGENPFSLLVEDVTRDLAMAMRFRALTRHIKDMIQARRDEGRMPFDWLSMLMEARDKDTAEPMSERALLDEVMTLIVAGHETTAGTLNWIWYLLAHNPVAEAQLHTEVDALAGEPAFDDLPRLEYARQIAEEALRLYPPVWLFSRKALGDDTLSGQRIPAGSDIFLSPWLMQRDPSLWPQPEAFRPERYADPEARELKRTAWYPFSLGSRRCIGEFFSMVDMQLHLGLVARKLRFSLVSSTPVHVEPLINLRSMQAISLSPIRRSA